MIQPSGGRGAAVAALVARLRLGPVLGLVLGLAGAPAAVAQDGCGDRYTVRAGDTLTAIAGRCATSVEALMQANTIIEKPGQISVGWELTIPGANPGARASLGPGAEVRPPARDEAAEAALAAGSYDVQPADSFASIATALRVPMRDLMAANAGIDPFDLRSGQTLTVPAGTGGAQTDGEAVEDGAAQEGAASDGQAVTEHRADDFATNPEPGPGDAAERLTLEGRVQTGAECPVLETPQGDTYSLVSAEYAFAPGEYVEIEGETVEMSFCGQGRTTVRVTSMSARAPRDG